jgi:hypothetical protein
MQQPLCLERYLDFRLLEQLQKKIFFYPEIRSLRINLEVSQHQGVPSAFVSKIHGCTNILFRAVMTEYASFRIHSRFSPFVYVATM